MKYVRTNNSETNVNLALSLDAADLASIKPKTLGRLAQKIKVPGFRQGKVPTSIAEKHLDSNVLSVELAEDAVNHFMVDVLQTEELQPLDKPHIELDKYVPSQLLEFKTTVEILPKITLGDYKKLKAKKEVVAVSDKDIADVIERMQRGMATKQEVKRAAKLGDEVSIDFSGTKDGKDVAGAKGKDYPLTLGSNTFIPGFEEGLVGKKAGDTLDLELTFPDDYQHKPLAGAQVIFAITVKSVREVTLPEVDDSFAAKCGPFQTVEELRADVARELTEQREREAVEKLKDSLVEQLVKGSNIPLPEILIADQLAGLEQDFVQNLLYRGMTLQQYLDERKLSKEEWRNKELREQAVRRVEVGLALAELSKVEKINVSMDELNQRLSDMLQQYGKDPHIRSQLGTPEARRDIANRLVTEKAVDRLIELNAKR